MNVEYDYSSKTRWVKNNNMSRGPTKHRKSFSIEQDRKGHMILQFTYDSYTEKGISIS